MKATVVKDEPCFLIHGRMKTYRSTELAGYLGSLCYEGKSWLISWLFDVWNIEKMSSGLSSMPTRMKGILSMYRGAASGYDASDERRVRRFRDLLTAEDGLLSVGNFSKAFLERSGMISGR